MGKSQLIHWPPCASCMVAHVDNVLALIAFSIVWAGTAW